MSASPGDGARDPAPAPRIRQPARGYRFSADSLLLADFAASLGGSSVLDLGTGCGIVLLLLARRLAGLRRGVGIEIQPELHACAVENFAAEGSGARLSAVLGDFRRPHSLVPPGAFDLVVANPPFRKTSAGRRSPDSRKDAARTERFCSLPELFRAARRALTPAGRVAVIALPSRLPELLAAASGAGISPRTLRFVHAKADAPAARVLFAGRAGGRGEVTVLPPLAGPA